MLEAYKFVLTNLSRCQCPVHLVVSRERGNVESIQMAERERPSNAAQGRNGRPDCSGLQARTSSITMLT